MMRKRVATAQMSAKRETERSQSHRNLGSSPNTSGEDMVGHKPTPSPALARQRRRSYGSLYVRQLTIGALGSEPPGTPPSI